MRRRDSNGTGRVDSDANEKNVARGDDSARRESSADEQKRKRHSWMADLPAPPPSLPKIISTGEELLVFCEHADWLREVVLGIMRSQRFWGDADDLLNGAVLAMAKHLHNKGRVRKSVGFLAATVRYSIFSIRRSRSRQTKHLEPYHHHLTARRNAARPEDLLFEHSEIREAMKKLPATEQSVLAGLAAGKTLTEIARTMGCSVATVWRRSGSALAKLRRSLAA